MRSDAQMPTVDVIIVNWNCGDQLRDCLCSIEKTVAGDSVRLERVVVVDNASTDGSADALEPFALPLSVIINGSNRGFAAACNQGAQGSAADYLLFLNPDTRLFAGSLAKAVHVFQAPLNERVGILGVQLLDSEGRIARTCSRFLTPAMVLRKILGLDQYIRGPWLPQTMTDWDHATTARVEHVMGAFFLVRRALFQRLGGMDERFFVYLEDVDFSLRAHQMGFDSLYLAQAQIFHRSGGASSQAKARRLYYALASRILYGFKHFPGWKAWILLIATLSVEPVTRIVHALLRGSPGRIGETLGAYWFLLHGLPTLLDRRNIATARLSQD